MYFNIKITTTVYLCRGMNLKKYISLIKKLIIFIHMFTLVCNAYERPKMFFKDWYPCVCTTVQKSTKKSIKIYKKVYVLMRVYKKVYEIYKKVYVLMRVYKKVYISLQKSLRLIRVYKKVYMTFAAVTIVRNLVNPCKISTL